MNDERRRFFRIDDTVGVAYKVLSEEELNNESDGIQSPTSVFSLLANYDASVTALLEKLDTKDTTLTEILSTLNKKINTVINQLELDTNIVEKLALQIKDVNISACGMAFHVDEDLQNGQTLRLDISLHPSNQHVFTYATVVHSELLDEDPNHFVRVNFHGMRLDDQETLIQHIVKRQGTILRTVRESRSL